MGTVARWGWTARFLNISSITICSLRMCLLKHTVLLLYILSKRRSLVRLVRILLVLVKALRNRSVRSLVCTLFRLRNRVRLRRPMIVIFTVRLLKFRRLMVCLNVLHLICTLVIARRLRLCVNTVGTRVLLVLRVIKVTMALVNCHGPRGRVT